MGNLGTQLYHLWQEGLLKHVNSTRVAQHVRYHMLHPRWQLIRRVCQAMGVKLLV